MIRFLKRVTSRLGDVALTLVLFIALVFLLGGCATTEPVVKTVPVSIPVPVPCKVALPTEPVYVFKPPYSSAFEGTRDLLGDRTQSLTYEQSLRDVLKACQ